MIAKRYIEEGNEKFARLNVDKIIKDWNNNFAIVDNYGEYFIYTDRHHRGRENTRIPMNNAKEIISKMLLFPLKNSIFNGCTDYVTQRALESDLNYYNRQLEELKKDILRYESALKEVSQKGKWFNMLRLLSDMDHSSYMHSILKYIEDNGNNKECSCAGTGFYPIICCDGYVCGCGGQPLDFDIKCPECGKEAPKEIPQYVTYNISYIPVIPEKAISMYSDLLNHKKAIEEYKEKFKMFKWIFFKNKKIIVKKNGIDTHIEVRYAQVFSHTQIDRENLYVDITYKGLDGIIKLDIFDEIVYNILNEQYMIEG